MRSGNDVSGSYVSLGDAIGVLRSEPDQLARGLGLKFWDAHDDLDAIRIARIRIADGRTFALVRHRHAPEPGTPIVMTTPSSDLWGHHGGPAAASAEAERSLLAASCGDAARRESQEVMKDHYINIFWSDEDAGYIADIPWLEAARREGNPIPVPKYRAQAVRA